MNYLKAPIYINLLFFTLIWLNSCQLDDEGLKAEVKPYNNRPTIHLNGEPQTPMIYALSDVPGGRWSWEEVPQQHPRP